MPLQRQTLLGRLETSLRETEKESARADIQQRRIADIQGHRHAERTAGAAGGRQHHRSGVLPGSQARGIHNNQHVAGRDAQVVMALSQVPPAGVVAALEVKAMGGPAFEMEQHLGAGNIWFICELKVRPAGNAAMAGAFVTVRVTGTENGLLATAGAVKVMVPL